MTTEGNGPDPETQNGNGSNEPETTTTPPPENTNTEQGSGSGEGEGEGTSNDGEITRAELERARQEAARYRVERNNLKQQQDKLQSQLDGIAKALGLKEDETPDPDKITQELNETRNALRQERMRNTFHGLAAKHNADSKLAWSYLYANGLLSDLPEGDELATSLEEKLTQALKDEPKLRNIVPTPTGGSEGGNGSEPASMNDLIRSGLGG